MFQIGEFCFLFAAILVETPEGHRIGARLICALPQKYFNDIRGVLVFKGNIWVITSTVDEKKGVPIDGFNFDGKYIDKFYLRLGEQTDYYSPNWSVGGDFLYTIEHSPDDDPLVVKYKIDYR